MIHKLFKIFNIKDLSHKLVYTKLQVRLHFKSLVSISIHRMLLIQSVQYRLNNKNLSNTFNSNGKYNGKIEMFFS